MSASPSPPANEERAAVTVLEQVLWRDLTGTADDAAFWAAWLGLTGRGIAGAIGGALLLREAAGGALRLAATWPAGAGFSPALAAASQAASDAGRGVIQPPAEGVATCLALPVSVNGTVLGVVAVEVTLGGTRDPRAAMRQLQWASAWVRERLQAAELRRSAESGQRVDAALDILAASLEQLGTTASARAVATELATRLACERVSVGFVRGRRVRLASVSHSAAFGERMTRTRTVEEAMDEAVDQLSLVLVPPPDETVLVTRAHERLAALHGPATVLTVPMLAREKPIGALTFERPADRPFTERDLTLADAVGAVLGPAFADKRAADRTLPTHLGATMRAATVSVLGPGHLGRKLAVLAVAAVALAAWFARGEYQVHAHARIAGAVQRAVVAPFDGFVREAPVRAGEDVRAGALMAALDDRDLVLERLRWSTERSVHAAEYDQALSAGKRADVVRLQSQIAQADAQIRLADEQLARTHLTAPFDGLVVSGDLSQSIGAPVRRGDVLFEVTPLDDYRVELDIPETQVTDVAPGLAGTLVVASLPEEALPFAVRRVTPVAEAKDGQVTFRAEGALDGRTARLRPGMEGVARIDAGRARIVWIWTRSLRDWLRLATWSWLP